MDLTSRLSGVEGQTQAEHAVARAMGTICDAGCPNSEVRDIAGLPTAADTQRTSRFSKRVEQTPPCVQFRRGACPEILGSGQLSL